MNILTLLAENEKVVKNETDGERRAIALAWLFHLAGDIHQPLHTAQLFTVDYPNGDRGGNEIYVRVTQARQPMDLHRFWDGAPWKLAGSSFEHANQISGIVDLGGDGDFIDGEFNSIRAVTTKLSDRRADDRKILLLYIGPVSYSESPAAPGLVSYYFQSSSCGN